uniref:Uncharacterized protein n=1 Tax=Rhizophora mucronata TaxID=61149 RepID=A0A2P2JUI8_RHIMU
MELYFPHKIGRSQHHCLISHPHFSLLFFKFCNCKDDSLIYLLPYWK